MYHQVLGEYTWKTWCWNLIVISSVERDIMWKFLKSHTINIMFFASVSRLFSLLIHQFVYKMSANCNKLPITNFQSQKQHVQMFYKHSKNKQKKQYYNYNKEKHQIFTCEMLWSENIWYFCLIYDSNGLSIIKIVYFLTDKLIDCTKGLNNSMLWQLSVYD